MFKKATKSQKHTPHMYTENGIIALPGVHKSETPHLYVNKKGPN